MTRTIQRGENISHLDPLQSIWDLWNILWHVKTFGSADFSIDQPLLEVSQGCTEPLLQQTLLILTLPGCSKAETAEIQMLQKTEIPDCTILMLWWGKAKNDMTNGQVEAWQSGWSGRNECSGNEWEWGMVVKAAAWGWGAEWQHMSGEQEFTGVANWREGAMTD